MSTSAPRSRWVAREVSPGSSDRWILSSAADPEELISK
jgi:hypothetical protein